MENLAGKGWHQIFISTVRQYMPNHLLYIAATPDEVNACAFALIKYLELCNLKPSPGDVPVVFTSQPAMLEAFPPFFHNFEFRPLEHVSKEATIGAFAAASNSNLLYFASGTFPVAPLPLVFDAIEKGAVFSSIIKHREHQSIKREVAVLGFNAALHSFDMDQMENGRAVNDFAEQYADLKDFYLLLRTFFRRYGEESIPNLVKHASTIDLARIRQDKRQYQQLPFYRKLANRLVRKEWNITSYVR